MWALSFSGLKDDTEAGFCTALACEELQAIRGSLAQAQPDSPRLCISRSRLTYLHFSQGPR